MPSYSETFPTTVANTFAGRAGIEARAEDRKRNAPPHLRETEKARWYAGWDNASATSRKGLENG